MTDTVSFEVPGLPPGKSEAKSMLSAGHPHASRVTALLAAAREALVEQADGVGFGAANLGNEVILTSDFEPASDATNYLGGIGDVLESKASRTAYIAHLGELGGVALFTNDRQLREVHFRQQHGDSTSYTVRLWAL